MGLGVIGYWLLVIGCWLLVGGGRGQNAGAGLSSVVSPGAGGRCLKWILHDPKWILGREWAKAVGPAKEASVGWCGWIPVGWLASKFWCQGPRNEARCRKSLVGGGVGGGKLYPKPQAGKNCTTNSSGNPMSAGRRRWAESEGFQGGNGGAADQRREAGPLAGAVFQSHAGRADAGCGPGSAGVLQRLPRLM